MINISFCYDAKGETYEIHVRFIGQYGSHEFEYAVADLLRHNGFREVQVTKNILEMLETRQYKRLV